jgi:NitT/TauT family transport system ATP-binding protein
MLDEAAPVVPAPVAMGGPVVMELDNVSFRYPNGLLAVDGLSLSVPREGVTAIVGPSGCGKSTMLKLISGLLEPSAGRINRYFRPDAEKHPLLMVFQQDTLLPWLRVKDNVALFYKLRKSNIKKEEIAERVTMLLKLVGLQDFAEAYPRELSGGMRRRVAFLAGVTPEPQLVLLDEPFSSVDEPTRVEIHQEVHRIFTRLKMAAILVTHDLAEAISLSDQVIIVSARPARVAAVFDVPLGKTRDMLELRDTPMFLELYGHLWHALSAEIKRSHEPALAMAEAEG